MSDLEYFLCLVFSRAEMAFEVQILISEECRVAINQVASYGLDTSLLLIPKDYYYNEDTGAPLCCILQTPS